jgi:hypothetical protein
MKECKRDSSNVALPDKAASWFSAGFGRTDRRSDIFWRKRSRAAMLNVGTGIVPVPDVNPGWNPQVCQGTTEKAAQAAFSFAASDKSGSVRRLRQPDKTGLPARL